MTQIKDARPYLAGRTSHLHWGPWDVWGTLQWARTFLTRKESGAKDESQSVTSGMIWNTCLDNIISQIQLMDLSLTEKGWLICKQIRVRLSNRWLISLSQWWEEALEDISWFLRWAYSQLDCTSGLKIPILSPPVAPNRVKKEWGLALRFRLHLLKSHWHRI